MEEDIILGGTIMPVPTRVVILDKMHQDRLDPKSPAYFGDKFIKGIKTYGFWDGKRQHCIAIKTVEAPYHSHHYFVNLYWCKPVNEGDRLVYYTYICYPDGKEDQIKVRLNDENKNIPFYDKIWFNGELVYDHYYDVSKKDLWKRYYNEKYFPWMKPLYDDYGNHVGNMPSYGRDIFYITK